MAGQCVRRSGGHLPAGLRRAGDGRRVMAQQQQRHARFLCRKGKAAAGGQVQLAHRPPAFHDHRPQRSAAQGIDGGTQQGRGIGYHAQQSIARRAAQFGPAIGLYHAACARSPLRPQPQHRRARIGHAHCHAHCKSRRAGKIIAFGRIDFMNTPPRQPAAQRGIERGNAQRAPTRQWLCALAHKGRNDSHMFILCSNREEDQAVVSTFLRGPSRRLEKRHGTHSLAASNLRWWASRTFRMDVGLP